MFSKSYLLQLLSQLLNMISYGAAISGTCFSRTAETKAKVETARRCFTVLEQPNIL